MRTDVRGDSFCAASAEEKGVRFAGRPGGHPYGGAVAGGVNDRGCGTVKTVPYIGNNCVHGGSRRGRGTSKCAILPYPTGGCAGNGVMH